MNIEESDSFNREDAYKSLTMINTWISNIDTKTSIMIALEGVLLGFVFSSSNAPIMQYFYYPRCFLLFSFRNLIALVLVFSFYIVSFLSMLFFILVLIARVDKGVSIYFFGSIANMEFTEYEQKVKSISKEELLIDLKSQVHINSKICTKKARFYNKGIALLIATIVLLFINKMLGLI